MAHTTTTVITLPARLQALAVTAALLQRYESGVAPADAGQYQALVRQAGQQLAAEPADQALDHLLDAFPVLSELYENGRYAHAGLCRQPLEVSLATEQAAAQWLTRWRSACP